MTAEIYLDTLHQAIDDGIGKVGLVIEIGVTLVLSLQSRYVLHRVLQNATFVLLAVTKKSSHLRYGYEASLPFKRGSKQTILGRLISSK